jgi:hypothetical protein
METWMKEWVQTKSLNLLEIKCQSNKELKVFQYPYDSNVE